jgi:uncharacterized protein (DUF1778 family)
MAQLIDRTTDSKARISLPKSFANTRVVIEEISDTEIRIRKAQVIAEDDLPFEEALRPLSDRDRDFFLALLDRPPKPSERFRRAAARYKRRHG